MQLLSRIITLDHSFTASAARKVCIAGCTLFDSPMDLLVLLIFIGVVTFPIQDGIAQVCTKPVDAGILLDASGSIGNRRWKQVVTFTQSLVNSFNVSEQGSHVAILLYSTKTSIEVGFDTFTGAQRTAANINGKIAAVNYRNWKGLTYIDRGLKRAADELFTPERGMRTSDEIKKILILFTDGKQTKDKEPYTELRIAAQPMKDKGIEIYGLGVGKKGSIDVGELQEMSSKPENVYTAESFDELQDLAIRLTQASCGVPQPQEVEFQTENGFTTLYEHPRTNHKHLQLQKTLYFDCVISILNFIVVKC